MALYRLATKDMIRITEKWVTRGHSYREALAGVPVLAALLPEIEEAHAELCAAYRRELSTERILSILHTQKRVDDRHDNVVRGIWHALAAESYFARDPKVAARLRELQRGILPHGLSTTQKSYREEAELAEKMAERLTGDDRALLARITIGDGKTLLDAIDEWISLAAHLGALESERAHNLDLDPADGDASLASRNQWARTVRVVRTVAALVARENVEVKAVMNDLDRVEKQTLARAARAQISPDADTGESASLQIDASAIRRVQLRVA